LASTGSAGERPGARESLQRIASSLVALLHTRVELAVVELREEGERRKGLAIHAALAVVFFALAAQLFALFVVVLFWDTHRIGAAAGVTIAYLAVAIAALVRMRRLQRDMPPPFEATLAELARDVEALKGRHE
jgi:uncharacterized membrane protein YqjE